MRRLLLRGHLEYQVTAVFSAQNTSSQVQIIRSGYEDNFKSIKIDGVALPRVVNSYKFTETGKHTVSYSLADGRTLGNYAFSGLTSLSSCTIDEGVTTIGTGAFGGDTYLVSLELPSTLTHIGNSAFTNCQRLSMVNSATSGECNIPNSVTTILDNTFAYCYAIKKVIMPSGLTSIGSNAFYSCSGLTTVNSSTSGECNIPNSVISIDERAFYGNTSLKTLSIPSSVTSIGVNPWRACSGLSAITVDSDNSSYDSRGNCNAIIETSTNTLITGCKNTVIPSTVTSIANYAFYRCFGLTSITIPNNVTRIGSYAFSTCSGLTSVTFSQNSNLVIDSYAFSTCYKITSIEIPNNTTTIGTYAFSNCSGLTKFNSNVSGECNIPNGVKVIRSYAFNGCVGFTSVNIPRSVTSITAPVWLKCDNVSTITVGTGNTKYDSRNDCNAIIETSTNALITGCKDTVIPSTVTSIAGHAFYNCGKLTALTIPNSVTSIGSNAFYSCSGLTTVNSSTSGECNIPNSVISIDESAFYGNTSLKTLSIPSSVTSIGVNPWRACSSLSAITVDSDNSSYDSRGNCNAIIETSTNALITGCKDTVIPSTVTSIANYAFQGSRMIEVAIPSGIVSIGNYGFSGCTSLSSVICEPSTPPTLGSGGFNSNASGRKIYVPSESVNTYKTASTWSTYASSIYAIP